jgi:hypothetical protein
MFRSSQLIIFFQSEHTVINSDFNLLIDEEPVEFSVEQNQLIINTELTVGVHLLKLQSLTNKRIELTDVQLDCASVRHGIYLSYLQNGNDTLQPCTAFWEKNQTWVLPFANPMSFWIERILDNLPQNLFGQDLQKQFNIHYPSKKINLPDTFTTSVRDFFKYDFNFVARSKNLRNQPIVPLNIDLSQTSKIVDEYLSIEPVLKAENKISTVQSQGQYNILENTDWSPEDWFYVTFYGYDKKTKNYYCPVEADLAPELWKQLESWGFQNYIRVMIICLEPGGYVSPHKDAGVFAETNNYDYDGCCQVYIPLDMPDDNYIKLAGVGMMDTSIANAFDYTNIVHCAVNNSNRRRYVLIIRCDIEKNKHLINKSFLDNLSQE